MPNILIFKETLLPQSETFILAQMGALKLFAPTLIGLELVRPSLPLPSAPILLSRHISAVSIIRAKLYRRTGIAPMFHAIARKRNPDLLHAHFANGGRAALPLARSLAVPLIVTLHGSDVTSFPSRPNLNKELARSAAVFLCVSRFIKERALAAGFPAEKLLVHYIGIDREEFAPGAEESLMAEKVLFVGRLVEKKGCEYLIRAMQLVQHLRQGAELEVIGDGPLRSMLMALATKLGVRCSFKGVHATATVRESLKSARVFCTPSVTSSDGDSEGLPTVLAEAQAMGIPVVSTLHAGIPEIISDGRSGWLVAERDHEALAEKIAHLLQDRQAWNIFHHAAIENIKENFDLAKQTARLEEIYFSLLRDSRATYKGGTDH